MKKYTIQELTALQTELYDILGEVTRICQKHNIPYFAIGGTAIGALYDQGILPWDDDIDIGMTRENYNRFLSIAPQELGKDYFLSWQGTDPHTPYYFAKVKKQATLFVEQLFKDVPMHQGIFVDIFPFDRIPDNKILRKLQYHTVNFLKCCLMGKEAWMWKHFGKCQIDNPTNRPLLSCLLNRMINDLLPKSTIYNLMVKAQSCFNSWNTRYFNNVITKTDHVLETSIKNLQNSPFGPLTITVPQLLEDFLRYNYPNLHRFTEEEQETVNNHYPAAMSLSHETEPSTGNLSPIALFVYNRLDNTQITIEHLKRNIFAPQSILYIFSDGGKDEESWKQVQNVRDYLHTITGFKEIHIIERPVNYYLERNIIEGIAYVLDRHNTIIVLEDDICTSPVFLKYMNEALDKYAAVPEVMHIAGFTNLDIPEKGDTYFTPHMTGWGWATWKNRWNHFTHFQTREEALRGLSDFDKNKMEYNGNFTCLKSLDRNPIPWDICWEICIYKQKGLCLHPTHTLVKNVGINNGTHFSASKLFGWYEYDRPYRNTPISLKDIPIKEDNHIEELYSKALKDHGMRYNLFGQIIRYVYKLLIKSK